MIRYNIRTLYIRFVGTHKQYDNCFAVYLIIMETLHKDFEASEIKMNELLAIATKKGGFDNLTSKERAALNKYSQRLKSMKI